MSKYKKGDKVRVRKDLKWGNDYAVYVNEHMEKMAGMAMEIFEALPNGNYVVLGNNWEWSDDILEGPAPKDLLQPGYVVAYRDGTKRMVIPVSDGRDFALVGAGGFGLLSRYGDSLLHTDRDYKELDIIKIYGFTTSCGEAIDPDALICRPLIWERKPEPKKMTVSEIAKALGYDVEIVKEEDDETR